ncbi:minichromosome maintenance protein MCM [Candidatus Marsarchaeota archaeon]|nr:minichromosome maintenance protein MCM [Candidatus Marsarchaeota archaeon]
MVEAALEGIKARFDDFFERYYSDEIKSLIISFPAKRALNVSFGDLIKFDPEIAESLIDQPDPIMEAATESLRGKMEGVNLEGKEVHVRFLGQNVNNPLVQDVGSSFISKMIMVDSLIVKRSEISPMVKTGAYKCSYCGATYKVRSGKDELPEFCLSCKRRSLKQVAEESEFINLQKIAVQDPLEKLRGSAPTWQLEVWLEDDLVNTVIPGDRIELTGVLRIRPRRNTRGKVERDIYAMFLDAVSIVPKQKEFAELQISADDERIIRELGKDPKIFEKIAKSVAPSIFGYDEIKKAVTLQLFGGTPGKTLIDGGMIRSDMHILLIGDPGSAKTRILQSVARLVPKGIYVSGKSVTGGGMTAIAERDDFSEGGWTLKAGALVLGSGGTVAIDEFDKVNDDDKAALHEALESQTISVAKAGIIATFNAKTAVLAAANPKFGRFDPNKYPAEQFDIPPTLLSRFDLIFPIKDVMDEDLDRSIAKHILMQHVASGAELSDIKEHEQVEKPPIDGEMVRKYIAYAKKTVVPMLSADASKRIQDYYIELRKIGAKQGATPITPRQIEGLIRMAEASAKARLSGTVEVPDAETAIALNEFMLKTLAVDRGGRIDIDTIMTGMPKEKVERMTTVLALIKKLEGEEGVAKMQRLLEEAEKAGMDAASVNRYVIELERSGDVFRPRAGVIKIIRHENE